ncbi:MAG: cupin domain-containing protein [Chitinophagaceae bacterium]
MITVNYLIETYQLQQHPEGGFYKETYKSDVLIDKNALPQTFDGDRVCSTAIYFLLEQGHFSAFHRIKSDECWHFYAGETLEIFVIHTTGELQVVKLGNDILNGAVFQYVVPANCWFASRPAATSKFSFVGCTVAPGFDFRDFELAKKSDLLKAFPQHQSLIEVLCIL